MTTENNIKNLTNDIFFDNALTILYQTCDAFERNIDAEHDTETEDKQQELDALTEIKDLLIEIRQKICCEFQEISSRDTHDEIEHALYNEKHY